MEFHKHSLNVDDSHISFKSNWIQKLEVYQTAMDHEQSVRTSYQTLLTTLEIVLISFVFLLDQFILIEHLWKFILLGVILCFFFGIACEYRARNVDIWRVLIVLLVQQTDVEKAFIQGKYQWVPYGTAGARFGELFGHWFERILITFLLLSWACISWTYDGIPPIVKWVVILAPLGWIFYAFRRFSPGGEIMLPDLSKL